MDAPGDSATTHYRVRWLFPSDADPVADATLEVQDGRIAGWSGRPHPAAIDLGNVAVIPGLVNAHTHLEFSHLAQPIPAGNSFAEWIGAVIQERRTRTATGEESLQAGLDELHACGTVAAGEIATRSWPRGASVDRGPALTAFREVLGLSPDAVPLRLAELREHLDAGVAGDGVRRGLSPHAPYSVHPDLFHGAVALARQRDVPVAMHLAETREELELLRSGSGPLVELFTRMGIWRPEVVPRGTRILDSLRGLAEVGHALVVHGNYLDDDEIAFLADRPNMTVVYCPRTHRHFGHARHPLPRLRERGIRVALGTDSRASSPSLDLWDDVTLVRELFPEVSPSSLLRMATADGAAALGSDAAAEVGLRIATPVTELSVVELADGSASDPWRALFAGGTRSRPFPAGRSVSPWRGPPPALDDPCRESGFRRR